MNNNTPVKLRLPRQDLAEFQPFALDVESALAWAQDLPVANSRQVVQRVRQVLADLNRVDMAPELRFHIIEALRPNLQVALAHLSRRFLHQPLVLPEEPRQMWEVADSLHDLVATAYTLVAVHAIQRREEVREVNPARLVCEALQRAIYFNGRRLLQTFQLYQPVELHGWLTLHQLYALAERQQLARLPVVDRLTGGGTITSTYLQALMLGCCKPNQLRQSDLSGIFRGLQEWRDMIHLEDPETGRGLFMVDLERDQPPIYSSILADGINAQCRYIDTAPLVEHLESLKAQAEARDGAGIVFDRDTSIPANLLDHLITSLGSMSMRNFTRTTSSENLWITVGLGSAHYHIGGQRSFEHQLYGDNYIPPAAERVAGNPFLAPQQRRDPWKEATPDEDYAHENTQEIAGADAPGVDVDRAALRALQDEDLEYEPGEPLHPVHEVSMVNVSPGGYCLEWSAGLPAEIRTGDIISIRERNAEEWVVAVLRWISQLQDSRTLVGVELLSPRAMPYGARIHHKTGAHTEPQRVLLLPEIKLVGQPHTLLAPRAGFKKGQKVVMFREGEEFFLQLTRQIAATGSFAQFDFRYIKLLEEVVAEDKGGPLDSPYDSLWSNI